jgi:hypothetical protein
MTRKVLGEDYRSWSSSLRSSTYLRRFHPFYRPRRPLGRAEL